MSSENSKSEETQVQTAIEKSSEEELDKVMPLEESKPAPLDKPMRPRGALVLNGETQKVISKYTSNLIFVQWKLSKL